MWMNKLKEGWKDLMKKQNEKKISDWNV
jgi:hypothetical protein